MFARITGWGQEGPLAGAAGHDINYISLAGALELMGGAEEPPPVPLNVVADFGGGGMLLAFGVMTALYERERSGRGQILDVAMVDGVASLLSGVHHLRGVGQWAPGRGRNWLQGAAPRYRPYRTSDDAFRHRRATGKQVLQAAAHRARARPFRLATVGHGEVAGADARDGCPVRPAYTRAVARTAGG